MTHSELILLCAGIIKRAEADLGIIPQGMRVDLCADQLPGVATADIRWALKDSGLLATDPAAGSHNWS
jgi:hypothetical protein